MSFVEHFVQMQMIAAMEMFLLCKQQDQETEAGEIQIYQNTLSSQTQCIMGACNGRWPVSHMYHRGTKKMTAFSESDSQI